MSGSVTFDCLAHQPQAHPTSAASLIAAVLSMDGRSSVSANSEPEQMQQIFSRSLVSEQGQRQLEEWRVRDSRIGTLRNIGSGWRVIPA